VIGRKKIGTKARAMSTSPAIIKTTDHLKLRVPRKR
jgi:hypothetical protein